MADREKVIKAIEICYFGNHSCTECELFHVEDCNDKLMRDVLELLKEQEAVEPRRINGKRNHFIKCGNCNFDLLTGYLFCPRCGKAVKWE